MFEKKTLLTNLRANADKGIESNYSHKNPLIRLDAHKLLGIDPEGLSDENYFIRAFTLTHIGSKTSKITKAQLDDTKNQEFLLEAFVADDFAPLGGNNLNAIFSEEKISGIPIDSIDDNCIVDSISLFDIMGWPKKICERLYTDAELIETFFFVNGSNKIDPAKTVSAELRLRAYQMMDCFPDEAIHDSYWYIRYKALLQHNDIHLVQMEPSVYVRKMCFEHMGWPEQSLLDDSPIIRLESYYNHGWFKTDKFPYKDKFSPTTDSNPLIRVHAFAELGWTPKALKDTSEFVRLCAYRHFGFTEDAIYDVSEIIRRFAFIRNGFSEESLSDPSPEIRLMGYRVRGFNHTALTDPDPTIQAEAARYFVTITKGILPNLRNLPVKEIPQINTQLLIPEKITK